MTGSSITNFNLVSLIALVRPPNTSRIHIIARTGLCYPLCRNPNASSTNSTPYLIRTILVKGTDQYLEISLFGFLFFFMLVLNLCFKEHERNMDDTGIFHHSCATSYISPFSFWGSLSAPSFYHLFHPFSVVDKRCSSTTEEILIQQSLVIMLTWISISQHPDRRRKQLRNFVHGGTFWDLFVSSRSMGHEGGVSRRMVKKDSALIL